MKEHINSQAFLNAFAIAWRARAAMESTLIDRLWTDHTGWTGYMLDTSDKATGFLREVCGILQRQHAKLEYRQQWYTIDALFVSGGNLYKEDRLYPSLLSAVIEHENGLDVETEMWKLLFWRSPLKVLIFYDWTTARREHWLKKKLENFQAMISTAARDWPEADRTEYLFIAGRRNDDKDVEWLSADSRRGLSNGFSQFVP